MQRRPYPNEAYFFVNIRVLVLCYNIQTTSSDTPTIYVHLTNVCLGWESNPQPTVKKAELLPTVQ